MVHATKVRTILILLLVLTFVESAQAQSEGVDWVSDFVVSFPQVARGTLPGLYFETLLVVSNPGPDSAKIKLFSSPGLNIPEPQTFTLVPGELRQVRFEGDPLQVGWVQLASKKTVAAAAHIFIKPAQTSSEILSTVAVLGQPRVSKVVIPVFVNASVGQNTGVALAYHRIAGLDMAVRFTLLDPTGRQVGSKSISARTHAALFVTELFPDIPRTFTSGSLLIEQAEPPDLAMPFAALALYTRGTTIESSGVTGIDTPGSYLVFLKSSENVAQQADTLAAQYGFKIGGLGFNTILATATREVARAIARDPRVLNVTLHELASPSPMRVGTAAH